MNTVIVTGSGGLVGSACAELFIERGYDVVGVDNDMRAVYFGAEASTARTARALDDTHDEYRHWSADVRDKELLTCLFRRYAGKIAAVVHAAAQPSHDWAAREPHTDFNVNAVGTLNLLECTRDFCPDAPFVFCSTNKVYGDTPNDLPLRDYGERLDIDPRHQYCRGVDTTMSIDRSTHSLFGVSKTAADLLVQEYGRYFSIPTVCFRFGCLTGPQHAGAQLHGFLAYLVRCAANGKFYTVLGHEGKQVRDNVHSCDVASAILAFCRSPRCAAVYNLGGGRANSVSVLEAIHECEAVHGTKMNILHSELTRVGDHRWWISDNSEFENHYPGWRITRSVPAIVSEIYGAYR